MQFYFKITSRGQKYIWWLFAQLYKNPTDCFVLEGPTVSVPRFQNRVYSPRLVIYPMSGNNPTLKIEFTDPRKRNFLRNLFYILDRK